MKKLFLVALLAFATQANAESIFKCDNNESDKSCIRRSLDNRAYKYGAVGSPKFFKIDGMGDGYDLSVRYLVIYKTTEDIQPNIAFMVDINTMFEEQGNKTVVIDKSVDLDSVKVVGQEQ